MAVFCVVHKMSELHCTVIVHSHLVKHFEDNFAAISRDRFQLQKWTQFFMSTLFLDQEYIFNFALSSIIEYIDAND